MKYELEDTLREDLFEKIFPDRVKDWELSVVEVEYDIDIELSESDDEFGIRKSYSIYPTMLSLFISIPKEGIGREEIVIDDTDHLCDILGEDLYHSIYKELDKDSESYLDQIIDRIKERQ